MLKVPSLFEPEERRHVKDMEHHVVVYEEIVKKRNIKRTEEQRKARVRDENEGESSAIQERDDPNEYWEQKKRITTPVSIEDLFKPRSLEAGANKSEIRRVLLYGNPGSGKTCISKAIAHKWALGEMLQEFKAIYVVPIRRLNVAKAKGVRGEAVEEVVAHMCFKQKGSDDEFKELKIQVKDDLDMPSTLLVFDGLDEADDDARELLSMVEKGECKLLIFMRPYNLQGILTKVDCQFECLGFNDQQLRNYINRELQQDQASRLIRSLQRDRGMWETAHTPVTAHIICSLSRERGIASEDQGKRASMFHIYGDMTNYVWKRFNEKQAAKVANKDIVFGDLEKIAFEALRKGQILIEERIVESHATSTNTTGLFKESGFLLFLMEGQQYQFPHLTFQEYFAGRFIARSLKNKGSDDEKRVLKFIQEGKYNQKNDVTMNFAMHAFARGRGEDALKTMLSTFGKQPVDVLGVRHFLLKMRILEATLEEADEDELEDLLDNEQAIELAEGARQLLERTIDDVLIREIVVEEFQNHSFVLEGFPRVLDGAINEVKRILRYSDHLTWKTMAKTKDVLKLARHSPKQSSILIQFALQLVEEPEAWRGPLECIRRLSLITEQMPKHAGEVLPTLAKGCVDEYSDVRYYAMDAIGRVVEAAPQHAGEVLPTLAKGCVDVDSDVRYYAMEAIGRVVAAAPQDAGEVLPTLAKGCVDEDSNVRYYAMDAISRVVEAAPQLAGEVLPTLVKGCVDEDSYVRGRAMEAIGRVVAAAPQDADEVLPTLAKGCVDEDSNVRGRAMEAIDRVVAAAPQLAGEALPTLAKRCVDEDSYVRRHAMEAIGRVVATAPQHAGEVLPTLAKGCVDEDSYVRGRAMEAIGRVVATAPQHADEVLPTLAKGCVDEDSYVRGRAMEAIGRVVAAAPQDADEVLPTLAKGCVDEDSYVRLYAMDAIGGVVAAAPQHAGEVLPTLAKGCVDEDSDVRGYAMEAIGRVVAAAPQHAGEVLPTLVKGCADEDSYVRRHAMEAIGRVVATAPQHADEVLPTLAKGCVDEDSNVRGRAMEAIGRVIAAAPQHAGEVLPTLVKGCADEDSYVRGRAMEAIGRVVAAAPQHAGEVLPTLAKGCVDEDSNVRGRAMEAIDRVVAAAPQLAGEALPTLAKGCVDEDSNVRGRAMEAIDRVVAAAPQLAGEALPLLAKGCVDEDSDVRSRAMKAIDRVVAAAPQLAGEALPTLAKGCVDEDSDVRNAARTALSGIKLEKVVHSAMSILPAYKYGLSFFFVQHAFTFDLPAKRKIVPFVWHTTVSKEVGKWNKDEIDVYAGSVRREFQAKFPGLLEHL